MPASPSATTAHAATDPRRIDEAIARAREAAPRWARATPLERAAVAREMLEGAARTAPRIVAAGIEAKGLPPGTPAVGDEWLTGAYPALRALRQYARSLEVLARRGNPPLGPRGETIDGRVTAGVFPIATLDGTLFPGIRGEVHFLEGLTARDVDARRARFHKAPDHAGRVVAVLGAGNVNSIPTLDVGTKLFVEGKVCVLKVNPVNAYVGPILEDAYAGAIARGILSIVYGGADEGTYLVRHPGVDEVHLTGSNATHDAVVWGPPGPERDARLARRDPLLKKEITSELGDVSPVIVAPGPWDDAALAFHAESVAGMVTQNGAFNCLAGRFLILPRGWRLRDRFLELVLRFLGATPPRRDWYPRAREQLAALTGGRPGVRAIRGAEGTLPWTLVAGLDPGGDDPAFRNETFCPVLLETSVGSEDPLEFLDAAVRFANGRLAGTLSAQLLVPPPALADPAAEAAVERAIRALRYGTIGLNFFGGGYAFAVGTCPWGGFPGRPLEDVGSGRGFVHNTLLLDGVEKTVVRVPRLAWPKPVYFPTHRTLHRLAPRLVAFEGRRDLSALPGLAWLALRA